MIEHDSTDPAVANGSKPTVLGRMGAWLGSAMGWNGRAEGPDPWAKVEQVENAVGALGARLAEVRDELRDGLRDSREAGRRTTRAVDELRGTLADLPALCREQNETLGRLAERLDASRNRTVALGSMIESLPQAMSAQAAGLQDLTGEVQRSNEAAAEMRKTLASLSTAVERLAAQSAEQGETILRVDTHAGIRERMLADVIEAQNKRFAGLMWLMVAALGVTLAMAVVQLAILTSN